jgi:hypothetical protein
LIKQLHASDSTEQQKAEEKVLSLLNKNYKLKLVSEKLVVNGTTFQLDGYSENPPVLCEIYSRIGKLKPAQKNKINKDILKMLLIEKMMLRQAQHDKKERFRKIIAFADEEAASSFAGGESWYSKLKENFNIEIIIIDIPKILRSTLIAAQKRQYR